MDEIVTLRAQHGRAVRSFGPDSEEALKTARALKAGRLAASIASALTSDPLLTDEQVFRIQGLVDSLAERRRKIAPPEDVPVT